MNTTQKKSFWSRLKLPHALTLLFAILCFCGVLSLILQWSGVEGVVGAGILDWFAAIPAGFFEAFWIIVFLFVIGGYINVVVKSKALESVIGKISKNFAKEWRGPSVEVRNKSHLTYHWLNFKEYLRQTWVIIPLVLFFSFAGTSYGMAEESLAFYVIIIPLAIAAGFDVWTGFLIIFVGAGAGVMASTINPFSVLAAVDSVNDSVAGAVTASDGAIWRWVAWISFTLITMIFVMWYAAKVKRNKNASLTKDLFENGQESSLLKGDSEVAPVLTRKRGIISAIFIFSFIFMVFAMLQYGNGGPTKTPLVELNEKFDGSATTSWFHNSKLDIYEKGGDNWLFGSWYFTALTAYFFICSLIIGALDWRGEENYINTMTAGAKDMIGVAFAIGLARGISVILSSTGTQTFLAGKLASALKGVVGNSGTTVKEAGGANILVPTLSYILFIPLTFFIPSTSGLANAVFPTVGTAINQANPTLLSGSITGYAWGAGLANLFVPTYGVVIGALAITGIKFDRFLRMIWKYLVLMFLVGLAFIILGGALNWITGTQIL